MMAGAFSALVFYCSLEEIEVFKGIDICQFPVTSNLFESRQCLLCRLPGKDRIECFFEQALASQQLWTIENPIKICEILAVPLGGVPHHPVVAVESQLALFGGSSQNFFKEEVGLRSPPIFEVKSVKDEIKVVAAVDMIVVAQILSALIDGGCFEGFEGVL